VAAVFGDTGTGKSSLARLLHQEFLDNGFVSDLLTNPTYPTQNSLLRTIAQPANYLASDGAGGSASSASRRTPSR
jgi:type II secretory pathway predicted ATPase ExeA